MASYQSIYRHYQLHRKFKGKLESWRFSFDPPDMNNWQLHVKGRYSGDKSKYLVEEIIGVVFDADIPNSIAFINPDFFKRDTKGQSARADSGGVNWLNNEDEFEIDDDLTGSDQNETLALESDLSWIRFTKSFDVYKQEQVKDSSKLVMNELDEKEAGREVSTDEPHQGGTLPAADVGSKQDITDRER